MFIYLKSSHQSTNQSVLDFSILTFLISINFTRYSFHNVSPINLQRFIAMRRLATCSFLNSTNSDQRKESVDSPLQLKLINYLGMKNYMIQNFIFRRKQSSYAIHSKDKHNVLFYGNDEEYYPPLGYSAQIEILETSGNSIPVCRLTPERKKNNNLIIYAHGNASDLTDSLSFVQNLSEQIKVEYVVFDYTGYGESRVPDIGEEVVCRDLEIVLAWAIQNRPIEQVILWGFSLGSFPVVSVAAKYPVGGVVLQCPIASISCIFHDKLTPSMKFNQDHFANINHICEISPNTRILLMHSSGDEIIPVSHSKVLFDKYILKKGENNISFVEVSRIGHNQLHKYITSHSSNALQKQVFEFLDACMGTNLVSLNSCMGRSVRKTEGHAFRESKREGNALKQSKTDPQSGEKTTIQRKSQQTVNDSFIGDKLNKSVNNNEQQQSSTSKWETKLKQLRMTILTAEIEQIPEDYQQIVLWKTNEGTMIQRNKTKQAPVCFCLASENQKKSETENDDEK